jgi:hypothetical protein
MLWVPPEINSRSWELETQTLSPIYEREVRVWLGGIAARLVLGFSRNCGWNEVFL